MRYRRADGRTGRIATQGLVALGLALTLVLAPACDSTSGGQMSDRPTASAVRDPVLQDIPKPSGFKLVQDQSLAISAGRMRLVKCQYSGSLDSSRVKRFYEEYMPSAGFELKRWSLDQGEYLLRFESEAEVCIVKARSSGWNKTIVTVEIEPLSKGAAERDAKPPRRRPD